MVNENLSELSKEELLELIEIYSKNWLALDGVWFQSVENKFGMDEAMFHDAEAWKRFTAIEATRIKKFLGLDEHPGLEGLERALNLRLAANVHKHECYRDGDRLIFTNTECRVQKARLRKGMNLHPCKSVGLLEYTGFAKAIDDRIIVKCLSCYPDSTETALGCKWEFTIADERVKNQE